MWVFTDIADWFDQQKRQANHALDSAVESSGYNQGVILVAAGTHAVMEFGGAFVDILRLGDGVKAGGFYGWGKDALRVVAIFPVGKAAQMMKTMKGTWAAQVVADIMPKAGICTWVASAKALRQIGHSFNGKILATVDDLVKATGAHPHTVGRADLPQVIAWLRQIGARVGPPRIVTSMKEVEGMVPYDGSVVLFGVKGAEITTGKLVAHLVYAYRNAGGVGRVQIMDRTITKATHTPYRNLAELAERYSVHSYTPSSAVVLYNVFARSVLHDLPKLVIPVQAVIASYKR
jgi:hypothetical protein